MATKAGTIAVSIASIIGVIAAYLVGIAVFIAFWVFVIYVVANIFKAVFNS